MAKTSNTICRYLDHLTRSVSDSRNFDVRIYCDTDSQDYDEIIVKWSAIVLLECVFLCEGHFLSASLLSRPDGPSGRLRAGKQGEQEVADLSGAKNWTHVDSGGATWGCGASGTLRRAERTDSWLERHRANERLKLPVILVLLIYNGVGFGFGHKL